jgi:dihydroxy-acid dehydratase
MLALAHEAEIDLEIEDFNKIGQKVPLIADLKPSGRYMMYDLFKVGGVPKVMKMLLDAGLLHGDCITVTGKTITENLENVV